MSNETTQKRSLSVSLGAAFLMATSAIGPGFLTQTSQFTAKYLSSFAFVIVCVIIMDMIAQTNVWSIVGVSGLRGQEIANKVLPGLGYLLVVLVVLGGLAFNIGNVGGVSLGFNAMIGIPEKAGVIIGGVLLVLANRKSHDKPYMLVIRCTDPASEAAAMAIADKLHDKPRVKAKTVTKGGVEITAEVRLRDGSTDFVGEISALDGVESAALVSYNGEYMG